MCYARRQRSSWARIKLSKKFYLKTFVLKPFSELICLSFLLLFEFSKCFLTRSLRTYFQCSKFLLFNFQRPFFRRALLASRKSATLLLYTSVKALSIPFAKVFSILFRSYIRHPPRDSFFGVLWYYIKHYSQLSRGFIKFLYSFL